MYMHAHDTYTCRCTQLHVHTCILNYFSDRHSYMYMYCERLHVQLAYRIYCTLRSTVNVLTRASLERFTRYSVLITFN